ncbi:hypothetical protein [Actinomadura litoris]|uniref:hypothetical protein n=1 Tax=Actinomadura litoris TaxID=2678616 RepID=UPI001FA7C6B8|nr:hypothetical protein [Actinomadura litoris]
MSAAIAAIPWQVWAGLLVLVGALGGQHLLVVGRRARRARRPACTCGCLRPAGDDTGPAAGRSYGARRRPDDEHQGDGPAVGPADDRDHWDRVAMRPRREERP